MLRITTLLLACLAIQAAPASHAGALCGYDGSLPGTGPTVLTVHLGDTYYVEDRDYPDADGDQVAGGLWVYRESNAIPGLQRGGRAQVYGWNDPCVDLGTPDTPLFGLPYGRTSSGPLVPCEFDGSIPGTPPRTYAFGAGPAVVYVDDRDYADLNGNGVAGGIWIYLESNGVAGLQRGGVGVGDGVPVTVPYLPPHYVIPPDPNRPVLKDGVLIFASGFGGGTVADVAGSYDPCVDSVLPDTLIF